MIRRRLTMILAAVSLLILLATIVLWVRSFYVADSISRANWIEQPLNDEAVAYAKQRGFDAKFISRGTGDSLSGWRGRIVFCRGLQMDVTSRWDENFEKNYVNKPNWSYTTTSIDDMSAPGGELPGVLGWLGFGNTETAGGSSWKTSYRYTSIPLWFIAMLAAILPVAVVRRSLQARARRSRGQCVVCGYDLRASDRCPECGTIPVPARIQSAVRPDRL